MAGVNQQQASGDLSQIHDRADQIWSEDTPRLVFENSPDAILLIDDGVFIDCNRAAIEMFRSTGRDQLLSVSPSHLSPAVQPDGSSSSTKAKEMIAIAFERGSHRFEWLAKRQDQTEFPAEVLLTAIPFKERPVLHAVWRDISRRRQVEQELSKSRECAAGSRPVQTVYTMGDAVIVVDRDYRFNLQPRPRAMLAPAQLKLRRKAAYLQPLSWRSGVTPFPAGELPLAARSGVKR
jgi:PAS domain S-box-containing protein